MDIIKMTRELAKELQKDSRYTEYMKAKTANDNDEKLQSMIHDFEMKRMEISLEAGKKADKDEKRVESLNAELQNLYAEIMQNKNMIEFSVKRDEMDDLLNQITTILTMCANGEDPDTCQVSHGCSGSCSTCGGCH